MTNMTIRVVSASGTLLTVVTVHPADRPSVGEVLALACSAIDGKLDPARMYLRLPHWSADRALHPELPMPKVENDTPLCVVLDTIKRHPILRERERERARV